MWTRSTALLVVAVLAVTCGGAGSSTGSGTATPTPATPLSVSAPVRYFPPGATWTTSVAGAAVDPRSAEIISWLDARGWGLGRFQIDFDLEVLRADAQTPRRTFDTTDDFFEPDCDEVPMPVPAVGNLEGEKGYACEGDGDCHFIVVDEPGRRLYEMWRADIRGSRFLGGCLAVWDLSRVYGPNGRGLRCTSADAAGYPIAPLLFTADEVAAGHIDHAVRFILPNSSIRRGEFVAPATHGTSATRGPASAPPYGAQLRLRADFRLARLPNEPARVLARALQTYGMFLADGGNVALTAQADTYTQAKWARLLGSRDLDFIRPSDFEVIQMPAPVSLRGDCVREP